MRGDGEMRGGGGQGVRASRGRVVLGGVGGGGSCYCLGEGSCLGSGGGEFKRVSSWSDGECGYGR